MSSNHGYNTIRRYAADARVQHSKASTNPYQHREKARTINEVTPAEAAAKQARKDDLSEKEQEAIGEAFLQIRNIAKELNKTFPNRTVERWYRILVQQNHVAVKSRNVNMWNAYLSKETITRNDGKSIHRVFVLVPSNAPDRARGKRRRPSESRQAQQGNSRGLEHNDS